METRKNEGQLPIITLNSKQRPTGPFYLTPQQTVCRSKSWTHRLWPCWPLSNSRRPINSSASTCQLAFVIVSSRGRRWTPPYVAIVKLCPFWRGVVGCPRAVGVGGRWSVSSKNNDSSTFTYSPLTFIVDNITPHH